MWWGEGEGGRGDDDRTMSPNMSEAVSHDITMQTVTHPYLSAQTPDHSDKQAD